MYRDSLGNGNWDSINYVPGNQYTMSDAAYLANPGNFPLATRWRVEAILSDSVNTGCTLPDLRPEHVNNTTTRSNTQHNTIFTSTSILTSASTSISVYPNPANQNLTIKFNNAKPEDARINIVDVTGREILTYSLSLTPYPLSMDVSALSAGVYFVKVVTNTSSQVVKFVKE
ncbi:MAG: T9SS type A sorting domain-containing protein [Bacteroidia bacterium]